MGGQRAKHQESTFDPGLQPESRLEPPSPEVARTGKQRRDGCERAVAIFTLKEWKMTMKQAAFTRWPQPEDRTRRVDVD